MEFFLLLVGRVLFHSIFLKGLPRLQLDLSTPLLSRVSLLTTLRQLLLLLPLRLLPLKLKALGVDALDDAARDCDYDHD